METYTEPRKLVENPLFSEQRRRSLAGLRTEGIDAPLVELVTAFNRLPFCFTLQSCFGHFLYTGQDDPCHIASLPVLGESDTVEYRIAYLAFCINEVPAGRCFLEELRIIPLIAPGHIQFCSADWFWDRQVNSYVLQVEPERFKMEDRARLAFGEAKAIESVRDAFFSRLGELIPDR